MGEIGEHKFCTEVELCYGGPGEEPVLVEIDVRATICCDSTEDGLYAKDIHANVVGRTLTENEIDLLSLESHACESFMGSQPCYPKDGDPYQDKDGNTWRVTGTACNYLNGAESFVMLERWTLRIPLGPTRTTVPLESFYDLFERVDEEQKKLERYTSKIEI